MPHFANGKINFYHTIYTIFNLFATLLFAIKEPAVIDIFTDKD